ncbi:MAG: 3-deoxy-manno-octulosonate cytidylyltransferase [Chitinophagales bacterium]|nr:3-deoxy-manno-octulosonate cytidylyltransferase [Chitinophagales bacterium]
MAGLNFVVFIPARYASVRLPGKPLCLIAGKTMIWRVYEQLTQQSTDDSPPLLPSLIDPQPVWVLTDDERIADEVTAWGGKVLMTQTKHQSGTERCAEGLQLLTQQGISPDIVVNIQGDEPLVQPEQVNALVSLLRNPDISIATLIKPISRYDELHNPNRPKVVIDPNGKARYFSRQAIPYLSNAAADQWLTRHTYYKHIGMYAYRTDLLPLLAQCPTTALERAESLEQLRWLEHGYAIYTQITHYESPAVDTPEDLAYINEWWRKYR